MRKTLLVLGLLAMASTTVAATRFMDISKIKRGMEGYGLTVFEGATIERFSVKIIGVLKKTGSGSDLILARLSGGPLNKTGVIAGMSGSPVYINGKMVGAVAYAWGFSKETIAGITPIKEMLSTFQYRKSKPAPPFKMKEGTTDIHGQKVASRPASFRPVATPLILSGMQPAIFNLVDSPLRKMGFLPILGGGAGDSIIKNMTNTLQPGSAIGVQLVGGDMNMTGIGTVTYTGPEGILAFGHPMMMRGFCSFPMTSAWIHTVMPNLRVSFKMGSPIKVVGTIDQDRTPAIAGQMGKQPDIIPVALNMSYGGKQYNYKYRIIRDPQLFSRLLSAVMLNTLTGKSAKIGELSCRLEYRFTFVETKTGRTRTVSLKDSWAALDSIPAYSNALALLLKPVNAILNNPFAPVTLKSVAIRVESLPDIRAIQISDLRCERKRVRPGETVTLRVELTPYRGTPFWRTVTLKVPESTRNGKIFFVVSGKAHERFYDRFFSPAKYSPTSLEGLTSIFNIDRDSTKLAVWSELYQTGLVVNGKKLPDLPESRFKLFASSQVKTIGYLNARLKKEYKTNYFLFGMKFIFLEVDHTRY